MRVMSDCTLSIVDGGGGVTMVTPGGNGVCVEGGGRGGMGRIGVKVQ